MSLQVLASVAIGVSLILCGYTIGVIAERRRSKRDK
jgi:hypothetical protein